MKKEEYCSMMHGDPYPPCMKPDWHCDDCKRDREKWEGIFSIMKNNETPTDNG